jgi:hypothetical protein
MRSNGLMLACALPLMVGTAHSGQPKNLTLQHLPGRRVQPSRAAAYTIVDGRMVLTSHWVQLGGATTRDIFSIAWDCIELDLTGGVLGAPTDNIPGCTPFIPAGNRWFFGATYSNPFVSADINRAVPGTACEGLGQAWYIDVGDSEPDTDGDGLPDSPLFIAVQQFENMDVVTCTDDGSGFIDGVIYDFSGNAWDPTYFNYTAISLNGSGLFHTMPADGNGGYQLFYGIAFDETTFTITIPQPIDPVTGMGVNIQSMLWGTHDHEYSGVDDGRCGEDVDGQYDDDAPIDGTHDLVHECYSYLFPVCPEPLAAATGFYFKSVGRPCRCIGELNDDNIIDIADLALFLSRFGSTSGGCADINGDGIVDIADLASLLSEFGRGCPNCG